jgi:hypothetical protein
LVKWLRNENGGLTVEGALVIPMFLSFLLALLVMTRIAMTATALHMAASETVKTVSAHYYPVQELVGAADDAWKQRIPESLQPYLNLLPEWKNLAQPLLCTALTPIVGSFADSRVLKLNKLVVTRAVLPGVDRTEEPFFGIEAEYVLTLPIPFIHKQIKLKSAAKERAWIGDTS